MEMFTILVFFLPPFVPFFIPFGQLNIFQNSIKNYL
jgi:hypothetical protein